MTATKNEFLANATVSLDDILMAGSFLVMGMTEVPLTDEESERFQGLNRPGFPR